MRRLILPLMMSLALSASVADDGKAHSVKLVSLEWPPYVGAGLPGQGAAAMVARAAFAAMGYELEIEFFPWARVVALAKQGRGFDGYFPEYYSSSLAEDFIYSEPFGKSPLGFVERRDDPVPWDELEDLSGIRIGTVLGYVNAERFDALAAAGALTVETVTGDVLNVRKVASGRLRLAVIDRYVLACILENDDSVSAYAGLLQFNAKELEVKDLFACFRRGERGEELAAVFNEGLRRIGAAAMLSEYLCEDPPPAPGRGLTVE